ncbi:hypothetical protein CS062_02265 [Roseateles chitinivorans]|uniref:Uncharacterized protein n=1 Tax=Roseateles chitinivorans TaxID=2917965 RepID=A0A2G9CEE0_9BURK|nr:hypothetical protein [Roseateles chitinivorans]PIM54735.1 hypothetical protein CS062_02265 [Roseateles chitinivorans]
MEATDVVALLRAAVKAEDDLISSKAVLRLLDAVEEHVGVSSERARQGHESRLAQYQVEAQSNLEMFRSVMDSGKEALNALILIGGGAVIALLSFLGNKADPALGKGLILSLQLFGATVLIGAVCHGFRYLCQVAYSAGSMRAGHSLSALTVLSALAGYGIFGWGVLETAQAFGRVFR